MVEMEDGIDQWVKFRTQLESRAIEREMGRILDAINAAILASKHKMLNDTWAKLQKCGPVSTYKNVISSSF